MFTAFFEKSDKKRAAIIRNSLITYYRWTFVPIYFCLCRTGAGLDTADLDAHALR